MKEYDCARVLTRIEPADGSDTSDYPPGDGDTILFDDEETEEAPYDYERAQEARKTTSDKGKP